MARIDTGSGARLDPDLVQEAIDKPRSTRQTLATKLYEMYRPLASGR